MFTQAQTVETVLNRMSGLVGLRYTSTVSPRDGISINSPASDIISKLKASEAKLIAYDPLLEKDEVKMYFDISYASEAKQAAMDADCIVIVTAHSVFKKLKINDFTKQMKMPGVIVDARQIFDPEEVLKYGLVYRGIGRIPKRI